MLPFSLLSELESWCYYARMSSILFCFMCHPQNSESDFLINSFSYLSGFGFWVSAAQLSSFGCHVGWLHTTRYESQQAESISSILPHGIWRTFILFLGSMQVICCPRDPQRGLSILHFKYTSCLTAVIVQFGSHSLFMAILRLSAGHNRASYWWKWSWSITAESLVAEPVQQITQDLSI